MCLVASTLNLLKMGTEMRLEGLGTDKNLEILIWTILFHQIFPRFRIGLRHLAFLNLEREIKLMEPKSHRVSLLILSLVISTLFQLDLW